MYIWLALLVPVLITSIGWWFNKKKYAIWEIFVPFGVTLVLILGAKGLITLSERTFTEYWGSNVTTVYENEPYNVWDHQTCYHTIHPGKNSTVRIPYDCSHQDDYGPSWSAKTNINETFRIEESQFDAAQKLFGTNKIVVSSTRNYNTKDKATSSRGTKFENKPVGINSFNWSVAWRGEDSTLISVATSHTYINKIKSSDLSKFDMKRIKRKEADTLHLFKYPKLDDKLNYPTILSDVSIISSDVQTKFQRLNGKFGPKNELRLWVLVFNNHNPNIAKLQEDYWVRGNMNELVVCIGVNKEKQVEWAYAFSWTKNNKLINDVENKVEHMGILNDSTWNDYYKYLNTNLSTFQRRDFAKEFSYLTVEPKGWHIIVIFIVALLASIGINIWVVKNEFEVVEPESDYENERKKYGFKNKL
ncbi:MAG: hypothetical protein WC554_06000 [Clostridia bacterium]